MKVALVNPPQLELKQPKAYPPLGLLSLASLLIKNGIEVDILNWADQKGLPKMKRYRWIGVTVVDATIRSVKRIMPHLKKHGKVVIGGPYPSVEPNQALIELNPDCVITGEGEYLLPSIVLSSIDRKLIYHAKLIKDLNGLPFPARFLMPDKEIVDYSGIHGQDPGIAATTISSSRGCSFHCAFCCKGHEMYRMHRFRSADLVKNELKYLQKKYGVEHVRFIDDEFTLNYERVWKLCRSIMDLDMSWVCITRADTVSEGLLDTMKQAGCQEVHVGVESFSDRLLSLMGKQVYAEGLVKGIRMIKHAGLRVKTYLMYGFPGETEEDRQITLDALREVKPDKFTVSMWTPLSGSRTKETDRIGWYYPDFFMRYKEQIEEAIK